MERRIAPSTRIYAASEQVLLDGIGVRIPGLSDRDIESLAREAGLGTISRTSVSTICRGFRDRYRAFRAR